MCPKDEILLVDEGVDEVQVFKIAFHEDVGILEVESVVRSVVALLCVVGEIFIAIVDWRLEL